MPPSSRLRISAIARAVSAGSARSTWMWSSGPASHGQSSGKGWREQVMTRQPRRREADHGGVADAAARSGQEQRAARRIGRMRHGHLSGRPKAQGYIRVLDHGWPAASRRNSTRSCSRNGRSCQNSMRERRDAPAAPARRPRHLADDDAWRRRWRWPSRRRSGSRAGATACWPRRRSAACCGRGGEIGVGLGSRHRRRRCRGYAPAGAAIFQWKQ